MTPEHKQTHNPRGYPDPKDPTRYINAGAPTRQQPDQVTKIHENEKTPIRPDNTLYSNVLPVAVIAATSAQILPENVWRKAVKIWNPTGADLYVKEGINCSPDSYSFILQTGQMYEPYPGDCHAGIWSVYAVNTGTLMVTEKT